MSIRLLAADALELGFGCRLGNKVVDTSFGSNGGGRLRVVTSDHHGPNTHLSELCKTFLDPALNHVFELNHPEGFGAISDNQRGATAARDFLHRLVDSFGNSTASLHDIRAHSFGRSFAN